MGVNCAMISLKNIQVKQDFLEKVINNNKYNEIIIRHYQALQEEFKEVDFTNNILSLENCNKYWQLDYYKQQKIKDFKKTNLCKDKFCNNCKKVKQASRLYRFMPYIKEMEKDNYLYHMVLTVPNCTGEELKETIKHIFKSFKYLINFLGAHNKIKGLDLNEYGYVGAIRSLEVTFNKNSYHPHLHCILGFNKKLNNNRIYKNIYSTSRKNGTRLFTDIEILIQKIWFLLINKKRVNLANINNLEIGYSCTIDKIDKNGCYEVFKYMTKATSESRNVLSYENFKTLYFALYKVRQIQGYGIFYNISDDVKIDNEVNEIYNSIIQKLQKKEVPEDILETPQELTKNSENIIISRKKIFNYLKKIL